jgi:glycosyltransferase involved in cell wall biosynthesis
MADSLLSLVLPAYKQEKTIKKDILSLEEALSLLPLKHEIIVVVDGYSDKTLEITKKIKNDNLIVLGYEENKGKGFAIKHGVKAANGDIIGFIDAGMDLDPKEISLMLNIMDWNDADIVVGSKLHPDSIVNYPVSRRILSWGYRSIIKVLFRLNVKDTQVGLKLFRRDVAKKVFPKIVVKAFAFDVEVLAVARSYGYTKIYEAPIKLRFRQGTITSTNFWKISFLTLWDTLAVFYRMNILKYYK